MRQTVENVYNSTTFSIGKQSVNLTVRDFADIKKKKITHTRIIVKPKKKKLKLMINK